MLLLILPETKYERQTRLTLGAGDRLLMYTDGAFEVFDDNGASLDVDGLCRLASQVAAGNGDAFLPTLFERIKDYSSAPLHDDVAMLSITMNGVVGR